MRDETITRRTFLGAAVLAGTSAAAQKDKNVEAVGAFTFREFRVAERVGKARTLITADEVTTSMPKRGARGLGIASLEHAISQEKGTVMRMILACIFTLAISCSGFGQTYTIRTVAGGALPNNIVGTSASLGPVIAIAGDTTGNVFFSAGNYGIVLRMAATTGTLTVLAGNGIVGYSGDNGAATSAELVWPTGISVDVSGNVYIADFADNRVRKVANGVITTVAGNGTAGYSGDGGPAASAQLNGPVGLAVDTAGNVYIADSGNNRVRKVVSGVITTVAGNGTAGYSGDGFPATSAE